MEGRGCIGLGWDGRGDGALLDVFFVLFWKSGVRCLRMDMGVGVDVSVSMGSLPVRSVGYRLWSSGVWITRHWRGSGTFLGFGT